MNDTRPVRATEQLDWQKIAAYLGLPDMEVEQFPGGHSNLTYLLRSHGREFVLRRPPFGPTLGQRLLVFSGHLLRWHFGLTFGRSFARFRTLA